MNAEIITIGDEILIGQIVDTNSAWMGQKLNMAGIAVKQITSVADDKYAIVNALTDAQQRADIILITGGLGPTKDDITKLTLCEYFKTTLVFNADAYQDVEAIFKSRGKEVTPLNRKQAEIPANCKLVRNKNGTAPCMWFEENGKVFVSMPGVPYEMKALMEFDIIPMLKAKFKLPAIYHKTILTQGIGESYLSELIESWEDNLKNDYIKLAYLPTLGKVRLRLSTRGDNYEVLKNKVEVQIQKVLPIINEYVYGFEVFGEEQPSIEKIVGDLLRTKKQTIATAESCTGGYIAHLLTSISGSSAYYQGSVIAYSYEVKKQELNVANGDLEKYGAVSEQVVLQMARGAQQKFKTDYAISASGIAGPDGGTAEKPVGTVWIGIATPTKVYAQKFLFGTHRIRNVQKTADMALNMLLKELT